MWIFTILFVWINVDNAMYHQLITVAIHAHKAQNFGINTKLKIIFIINAITIIFLVKWLFPTQYKTEKLIEKIICKAQNNAKYWSKTHEYKKVSL